MDETHALRQPYKRLDETNATDEEKAARAAAQQQIRRLFDDAWAKAGPEWHAEAGEPDLQAPGNPSRRSGGRVGEMPPHYGVRTSDVDARISGQELGRRPTSYGHLLMLAARFAREQFDGRMVINRQTRLPISLTWQRGLDAVISRGTPPAVLLAIPQLQAMLAGARYLGATRDPRHRPDVSRVHGFSSAFEIAGHRMEILLTVRENRRGEFFLDGIEVTGASPMPRDALKPRSSAIRLDSGGGVMPGTNARVVTGPTVMEGDSISRVIEYIDDLGVKRRRVEGWLPRSGWTEHRATMGDFFFTRPATPDDMRRVGMTDKDIAEAGQVLD